MRSCLRTYLVANPNLVIPSYHLPNLGSAFSWLAADPWVPRRGSRVPLTRIGLHLRGRTTLPTKQLSASPQHKKNQKNAQPQYNQKKSRFKLTPMEVPGPDGVLLAWTLM